MKKLFSLAMVMIMALALCVPAFAQDVATDMSGTGTITITNATKDETYKIYKVFDATYSGDNAAYTIKGDSAWFNTINAKTDMFKLTASTKDSNIYVITLVDGVTGEAVRDYLTGMIGSSGIDADASVDATEANIVFSNIPYGYYLVTSTLNDGGLVTVTNATPNATVIDKNQVPGNGSKAAEDETVEIGETTEFEIQFTTTNYDHEDKIIEYTITDDMPDEMALVGNVTVKVGDTTLTADEYTITYGNSDADDFTIVIPWVDDDENLLYESPNEISVTYSAKLLSTANIDGNGNTNKATINWTDKGGEGTVREYEATLYTFALAVKKTDKNGSPLAGAKFVLKNADDEEVKVTGANGIYTVAADGDDEIISPVGGTIVIKGVDSDDYTLTEIEAPTGYNLLTAPVPVKPVKTGETTTNKTVYIDVNGQVTTEETTISTVVSADVSATAYVVVNFTGAQLPSTGGMGTSIFYTMGGILMAGAAILLITKKKMANEQ